MVSFREGRGVAVGYTTDYWEENDGHLTIPFELLWPVSDRVTAGQGYRLGRRGRRPARAIGRRPARAIPNNLSYTRRGGKT